MQAKHAHVSRSISEPSKSLTPKQDDNHVVTEAEPASFFLQLHQVMRTRKRCWRICDQRVCKRAKKCCASQVFCRKFDRPRPEKPWQIARAKAEIYRMLKAESERRDALEAEEEKAAAAAKSPKKS